ncbi:hypothetical protein C8J56DRAFT_1175418 [Mycena floridula]|nr:hypothetical protein C8J56DRAFT_1175418 [Mycena floridula]
MRPRRQKQPIALPLNQENVSGEKAGRPRSVIPDAVAREAVPAPVDQQDLEDSNESLDGLDQVHIAMRMQQEQIRAMRAELDALARPPDYQST